MLIRAEDIARVLMITDPAAVVGESVGLREVGTRLQGFCPFHSDELGSFWVNPLVGGYYCFECQAHGDVITFVRETQHLDLAGAVQYLARKAGIDV